TAFNADFDGDQMAVHLPLSVEAQAECRFLMLSPNNLLKPSDGDPVAVPSQDMVLGIYYLTQERPGAKGEGGVYKDISEAILAYENKVLTLQSRISVRVKKKMPDGSVRSGLVSSTLGRFLFNEIIPQDLGFVDRQAPENVLKLEVDKLVTKKDLKSILGKVFNIHGATKTAEVLDDIKKMGYGYSTRAGMTVSISDMTVPASKAELLEKAQENVDRINMMHRRGFTSEEERYRNVVETWKKTDDQLTKELLDGLDQYNNIHMMAHSGARGSDKQIKQLAGMRGLMADTTGHTIELPIKSNFREGLDVLEYFMSAHGARKGLSDTALRTADSGYLTRRMVVVSQDLVIREMDCCEESGEIPGRYIRKFAYGKELIESLQERITGRYAAETIVNREGEILVKANSMITRARAERIIAEGVDADGNCPVEKVKIRTILTCRSRVGICAKCYGSNMATGEAVQVGEPVGIIAAQSIGEPGTQLTMRTFHTGGVAGGDITQGLPRVEELFEARRPKGMCIISEIDGVVELRNNKKKEEIVVTNQETGESKAYLHTYGTELRKKGDGTHLQDGDVVAAGDQLTEGSINPHDLLKIKGVDAVQDYLLQEVQRVYRLQGVEISDKHIEVLVRQMLKKVEVDDPGDSQLLQGTKVDALEFDEINRRLEAEGLKKAECTQILLGITKASLATESFLSAASFQETTKVLTDAAIKGKVDHLVGPMENVIIGKLIPAGTGMKRYRNVRIDTSMVNQGALDMNLPQADPFDGIVNEMPQDVPAEVFAEESSVQMTEDIPDADE
ncbi:MAG: DNA-directed RNA polymerase subunit beta', partial [Lachnospiraceae bacterium]|nr:DNA-directed RNA polymerase subunit beta' [Lachnospiraceae bacterium]